ncbi:ECF subfamily RNA polymerase sigma factor, BldN family [Streptomyces albus]|uniref:ECF subfamily RNA polymerase sigma factor, BldN family n=1 Tax=Streptomyces albus TaxID=1888 RepID=UPI0004CAA689|nr:ECF subfamily RNA polymerase sigma factor, BldN family [Streptomyces albus]
MYPHVGVDASGLATLRAAVLDQLRGLVPSACPVPALAVPAFAMPSIAAGVPAAVNRRVPLTSGAAGAGGGRTSTARRPAADGESRRMMDLVERAQDGEAEAFGRLYDQYADTVYRYVYYRVGSRATAEDLTSETFLRALRRISTFTWQGRDFGAWLVTIARNLVADHFKSSRFRLEITTGEMLDANEVERSPEDSVLESLSNATLLDAVRRLNPQQQECVTLRFLQGMSVAETARAMGKNEGAIKTLQYRAVRTLARLLPEDAR